MHIGFVWLRIQLQQAWHVGSADLDMEQTCNRHRLRFSRRLATIGWGGWRAGSVCECQVAIQILDFLASNSYPSHTHFIQNSYHSSFVHIIFHGFLWQSFCSAFMSCFQQGLSVQVQSAPVPASSQRHVGFGKDRVSFHEQSSLSSHALRCMKQKCGCHIANVRCILQDVKEASSPSQLGRKAPRKGRLANWTCLVRK